jgi:hypothetical protein
MTKGEKRKARKEAHANGQALSGELALDRGSTQDAEAFSESPRGYDARDRWARYYDSLNGAPENDDDR